MEKQEATQPQQSDSVGFVGAIPSYLFTTRQLQQHFGKSSWLAHSDNQAATLRGVLVQLSKDHWLQLVPTQSTAQGGRPADRWAAAPAPVAPVANENANLITIKSPMIGTFYRSGSPDKPSFVNVGDKIGPGNVLCVIEAMKLFNEIESEVSGKIVKILIDNASPIEYDQPLFLVEPM